MAVPWGPMLTMVVTVKMNVVIATMAMTVLYVTVSAP